jgi:hypothetical protein
LGIVEVGRYCDDSLPDWPSNKLLRNLIIESNGAVIKISNDFKIRKLFKALCPTFFKYERIPAPTSSGETSFASPPTVI